MKVACLIPCRSGSKGIAGKNFRDFLGKPLWRWTYDAAVDSGMFDLIIVSSDKEFETGPKSENTRFDFRRPDELSDDSASLDDVLVYYYKKNLGFDAWVILQPTSPLRDADDIRSCVKFSENDLYDSVVAVTPGTMMYWIDKAIGHGNNEEPIATYHLHKRPNRQDRKDFYQETGAIYVTKSYTIEHTSVRLGGHVGIWTMDKTHSYEIDDPIDWIVAETVGRHNGLA